MNVTLRQLRVFIEVSRLQSFSRAGDEIGLTQSAVSRCVRELEAEIGLKLIDRTTSETLMTDSFCLVSRSDHRLAGQKQVAWSDLDGEKLVMLDQASGSRPIIDAVMSQQGVSATVVQELGHPATVFGLVQAGVGVSV